MFSKNARLSYMKKYDIAILTDHRYIHPKEIDTHNEKVLLEDKLVQEALERKGFSVIKVDWADKNFDWSSVQFSIFRSTWDYMNRFPEFEKWFHRTRHLTNFINSAEVIEWNMDKHYLADLHKNGLNIPKTLFIEPGTSTSLQEIMAKTGWDIDQKQEKEDLIMDLLDQLQPFIPAVVNLFKERFTDSNLGLPEANVSVFV